jgi:adenylate cyclase, class 2
LENRETEVKFYVRDIPAIEQRLRHGGAACVEPRRLEVNYRFDTSTEDLKSTQRVLRLRQCGDTTLTFKGPSEARDGVLSREEIEVKVDDLGQMRLVLEALGYAVIFVYEKYRAVYELGGVHVLLDELPFGNFVEIEGEAAEIRGISDRLGLEWSRAVPAGYAVLFETARAAFGLPFRDLTYANFTGRAIRLDLPPAD